MDELVETVGHHVAAFREGGFYARCFAKVDAGKTTGRWRSLMQRNAISQTFTPPEVIGPIAGFLVLALGVRSQITPVRVRHGVAYLQPIRFLAEMAPHAPAATFNTPL